MSEQIGALSGIYSITCIKNGRFYVGSSSDIYSRWQVHRRELTRGNHRNTHLQSAWGKHGETAFRFSILELVAEANLLTREQWWIDHTGCTDSKIGFNVKVDATSAGHGIGLRWVGFRDPSGRPVVISNLSAFCRQNRLDFPSMHRLSKGVSKLKSYKGWTHANSIRKRDFIKIHRGFVDPTGQRVRPIRNLADFCRRNGLSATHMVAVAKGRILSHKGWTHVLGKQRQGSRVYRGYISPDGTAVEIANLRAFCRANNLNIVHMHDIKSGKRARHKGWTWMHESHRTPQP